MSKYIKKFESFKLDEPSTMSELLEKLSVVEKNILDSIKAEVIDTESFFGKKLTQNKIEDLINNSDFNKLLSDKNLDKGNVEYTEDYETFLLSPFKYLLIKSKNKSDLHDPDFIMIQTYNSTQQKWNRIRMYKINGDFKNFYSKLADRTIEIKNDDKKYIYRTSSGKNEWELTNQEGNDSFPKIVRGNELLDIINKYN